MISLMLEILVGFVGIYLSYSLLCSSVLEAWAQNRGTRGKFLRDRIMQVFGDGSTFDRILEHPVLSGLVSVSEAKPGAIRQSLARTFQGHLQPGSAAAESSVRMSNASYLPSKLFAVAALTVASGRNLDSGPADFDETRRGILHNELVPHFVKEQLIAHVDAAGGNLGTARDNVAGWYDDITQRLSGTYQRSAKRRLLWIGFLGAIAMNIDALSIYRSLSTDEALRKSVVSSVEAVQREVAAKQASEATDGEAASDLCKWALDGEACRKDPQKYFGSEFLKSAREFSKAGLPIGWAAECTALARSPGVTSETSPHCWAMLTSAGYGYWLLKLAGFLLSGLFVSFGAPFWFDLLNLVFRFRGSGGKPDTAEGKA